MPTNLAVQSFASAELASNQVRAVTIANAWNAYHGRFQATHLVKRNQVDDNLRLNFTRLVVDKGVGFLFGNPFTLSVDGDDVDHDATAAGASDSDGDAATAETDPEAYLEAFLAANKGMALWQKAALNGAAAGQVYLKLEPADPARNGHPYPRVLVVDPATVEVQTEPDDHERVQRYLISYPLQLPSGDVAEFRQTIEPGVYVADVDGNTTDAAALPPDFELTDEHRVLEGWRIFDQISRDGGKSWVPVGRVVWPFRWAPIFTCQNLINPNDFWGLPDVDADLIGMNRAVNFTLTNIGRVLRYHAHPKTWGKGFTADQLRVAPDEVVVLQSKDAELKNLEMSSDLGSSVAFYRELKAALLEIKRTPNLAADKMEGIGSISSLALKLLYEPLIKATEAKQLLYGALVVELCSRVLELAGFGEGVRPSIGWPELLPQDPAQEAQTLLLDQQMGVSKRTALLKRGYDPDVEADRRKEDAAEGQAMAAAAAAQFDAGAGEADPPSDSARKDG